MSIALDRNSLVGSIAPLIGWETYLGNLGSLCVAVGGLGESRYLSWMAGPIWNSTRTVGVFGRASLQDRKDCPQAVMLRNRADSCTLGYSIQLVAPEQLRHSPQES